MATTNATNFDRAIGDYFDKKVRNKALRIKSDSGTEYVVITAAEFDVYSKERQEKAARFMKALKKAQKGFEGEAERLGLKTLDDVVALVKEVRAENESNG